MPRPLPLAPAAAAPLPPEMANKPLNNLARHVVALVMAIFNKAEPNPRDVPATVGDAYALVARLSKDAFGR